MLLKNVKDLCKERGISICALEKELNIGNGSIAKWDSSDPRIGNVKKVADYLGKTVDELLQSRKEEPLNVHP